MDAQQQQEQQQQQQQEQEQQQQQETGSSNICDSDKCQKIKRFIIVGLLITIGILSWHFYEYFHRKPLPVTPDDMLTLSKELFIEEAKASPYLYKVNLQGKTDSKAHDDRAALPLFELHNDLLAKDASSTAALLQRLYNNYELNVAVPDRVTAEHEQEQREFLRAVMNTRVMKLTMRFLVKKDLVSHNYDDQFKLLQELWFTPYSRGKQIVGSSSFEHVFMAELRDEQVLGLHNWLYFAEQEQQGHLDYKGWIERVETGRQNQFLLALRWSFYGKQKPYNGLLVGTSPELEMSLYTVCFLVMPEQKPCEIQLGHAKLSIVSFPWNWQGKRLIATSYVQIP